MRKLLGFLLLVSFGACLLAQGPSFPGPGMPASTAAPPSIAILAGANGHAYCGGDSTCTTSAIDTTGATLIVITSVVFSTNTLVVSDSKLNTIQHLSPRGATNKATTTIHYIYGPTVGSGHTFTCAATLGYPVCMVSVYSGTLTTSGVFDVENGGETDVVNSQASGSITPSASGELIVSGWGSNGANSAALAVDSSLAILDTQTSTSYELGAHAYLVDSNVNPINATWSVMGTVEDMAVAIAAFKHP